MQLSKSEENHLRLRVKQLTYGSLNGMIIRQSLLPPYIPLAGTLVSWKRQLLGAGLKGLWSHHRARAAVDCRETD